MTTLNDILNLMPYAALDFSFDAFIQVVDYSTGAHYRRDEYEEGLTLGGNPVLGSVETLLQMPVKCIEYINDQCVISI